MPRLSNVQTGAVISCSDETAAGLGSEWEPADKPAKSTPKKASSEKSKK